jgi:single-strand DNA-binding protein
VSFNKNFVLIAGNLVRDAEVRQTSNGKPFVMFTVATSEKFNDKEFKTYIRCFNWRKGGDELAKHLTAGTGVLVTGKLNIRLVEKTVNGETIKTEQTSISVDDIDFIGKGKPSEPVVNNSDDDDDDVPF